MIEQQFRNIKLTRTKVKNNIIKVFNLCEDRHLNDWYAEAKLMAIEIAAKSWWPNGAGDPVSIRQGPFDLWTNKVVGFIAATSPTKRWEENLKIAKDFIYKGDCGHFVTVVNKCQHIYDSSGTDTEILGILKGPKTSRFYMSINYCLSYNGVTIDRHALSVALGYKISNEAFITMTKRQYEFFEECYIYTARSLGITPMLLQSATWQVFRERKKEFKKETK